MPHMNLRKNIKNQHTNSCVNSNSPSSSSVTNTGVELGRAIGTEYTTMGEGLAFGIRAVYTAPGVGLAFAAGAVVLNAMADAMIVAAPTVGEGARAALLLLDPGSISGFRTPEPDPIC